MVSIDCREPSVLETTDLVATAVTPESVALFGEEFLTISTAGFSRGVVGGEIKAKLSPIKRRYRALSSTKFLENSGTSKFSVLLGSSGE